MTNTLIDTRRKYGVEVNIDNSKVMRIIRGYVALRIKVGNREIIELDHSKYRGSILTRDVYYTREIKTRNVGIAKEALSTNNITSELYKAHYFKFVLCNGFTFVVMGGIFVKFYE